MRMINLRIKAVEERIIEAINSENLPIGVIHLILQNCLNQVDEIYSQQLINEQAAENVQIKEGVTEDGDAVDNNNDNS